MSRTQSLATIVIPVYKPDLTTEEVIALQQCFRILKRYPIHLITFAELDLSAYQADRDYFTVELFDRWYFTNIQTYNQLMLSYHFYDRFKAYQYMLLYQLDAYVFRDELAEWCQKGYDYIGAPWFKTVDEQLTREFFQTGNGGLSLRNIPRFLAMLETANRFDLLQQFFAMSLRDKTVSFGRMFSRFLHPQYTPRIAEAYRQYEDIFWAFSLNRKITRSFKKTRYGRFLPQWFYPQLRIAPVEDALRFSFERHPSYLYQLNQQRLPFGCHAWNTYEPEFWAKFIPGGHANDAFGT